jgi:hypothetical protein
VLSGKKGAYAYENIANWLRQAQKMSLCVVKIAVNPLNSLTRDVVIQNRKMSSFVVICRQNLV